MALCNGKHLKKLLEILRRMLENVIEDVRKVTSFFSVVIFGSYAAEREKKSSDLDVAVFVEDRTKVKEVERFLSSAKLKF